MRGEPKDTEQGTLRLSTRLSVLVRRALPLWLVIAAGVAVAAPPAIRVSKDAVEPLRAGLAASQRGDCAEADRQLRPLTETGVNPGRMDEAQAMAFGFIVACEARTNQKERAYADALVGTHIGQGSGYLWYMRLLLEIETERAEAAVATAESMRKEQDLSFSEIDGSLFYRLDQQLKEKGQNALREQLLKLLLSNAYKPEDGPAAKDVFRVRYARLLLDRGDEAAARARIAELTSPYWLRQVSVDPKLRALLDAELDLRAATEAMLKLDRDSASAHPDRLRPLTFAANDLRELGRPKEALRLLQSAVPKLRDRKGFTDRKRALPWWWDGIARSEEALGYYGEAVAAFREGMNLSEDGAPNVSQVINLAVVQTRFGHAADALKTLSVFDDPKRKGSPYGEMMLHEARGCAHAALGEKDAAAADVTYAKAHEKDAPDGLEDLLLCMGDVDGAAAVLFRRLDDPDERTLALVDLSDFADPAVRLPPPPTERATEALKARADVQAAIARAGGTRRFNVQRDAL